MRCLLLWPGVLSALLLPITSALMKQALVYYPAELFLLLRFAIAASICLSSILIARKIELLKSNQQFWHILRAIAGYLSITSMLYALDNIPVVNVIVLSNLTPIYLLIFLVMFKKINKLSGKMIICLILCVTGIILLLNPIYGEVNIGYMYGISIGFFTALSVLILRKLKKERNITNVAYYYIISTILATVNWFWIKHTPYSNGFNSKESVFWLTSAIICSIFYQYSLSFALKHLNVQVMAPLFFLSTAASFIIDSIFFRTPMETTACLYIVIICLSSIFCSLESAKMNEAKSHQGICPK